MFQMREPCDVLRVLLLMAAVSVVASSVAAAVNGAGVVSFHSNMKEQYHQISVPICSPMIDAVGSRIHDSWIGRKPVTCTAGKLQLARVGAP
jgi:hypothetical protein